MRSSKRDNRHAIARESSDPVAIAIARSTGHVAATAHMADHSLGAAFYALKAVKHANKSIDAERKWQNEELPPEIMKIVLTEREDNNYIIIILSRMIP